MQKVYGILADYFSGTSSVKKDSESGEKNQKTGTNVHIRLHTSFCITPVHYSYTMINNFTI